MKSLAIRRCLSATLLVVFLFGSIVSFAKSGDYLKIKTELKAKSKYELSVFINDGIVVTIPVNHIGYYDFAYNLSTGLTTVVLPVAHAPPVNDVQA